MGFLLYFGGHSHSHHGKKHNHNERFLNDIQRRNEANDRTPLLRNTAPIETLEEEEDNPFALESENKNRQTSHDYNINIRAAFIHVLGDLIQSIGVLIAALLILWNVNNFK